MAAVPGSFFRRSLFWLHLSSGVVAGLIVLVLSVTGVLLAYEKQLVARATAGNRVEVPAGQPPLGPDALVDAVRRADPAAPARFNLAFDADPAMAVSASQGRDFAVLLNPYTGEVVSDSAAGTREFMRTVTRWHRTLAGEGNGARATAVDLANLLFLFMVMSGLYLWLPAVWRWRTVRGLLFFRKKYVNAKVRDFSWHHVFGVWALIPLFLITLSGVVISYPWASALVYRVYGEQPPQRRGPPEAARAQGVESDAPRASLDVLLRVAKSQVTGWQRLTLPSVAPDARVEITAEAGSDAPRPPRQTITLNTADASVVSVSQPMVGNAAAPSPGQRARTWLRFIHTGEQYGVAGQTIAALASIAACFLVYSGLALAWRRLVVPLWRRRKDESAYASSPV